jgi:hypothetical protein
VGSSLSLLLDLAIVVTKTFECQNGWAVDLNKRLFLQEIRPNHAVE